MDRCRKRRKRRNRRSIMIAAAAVCILLVACLAGRLSDEKVEVPERETGCGVQRMALYSVSKKVTTAATEAVVYPLSDEEIELIALVTMAEAEGETELGQRLVIDTILNRVDNSHFPDTVTDVIYQPNQFSSMWNGRVDRCCVKPEIVELVREELLDRTNYECVFFMAGGYSRYGEPMFCECCHYFSSYD